MSIGSREPISRLDFTPGTAYKVMSWEEVVSPMLCRRLRARSWRGITPALVVCLALIGGIPVIPATWPEEDTPSLTPTNHDLPLTALAEGSGVRIEKQAQAHRLVIRKPDRSARLSTAERAPSARPLAPTTLAFHSLPRRQLYAARRGPSIPDDPSDPLLS